MLSTRTAAMMLALGASLALLAPVESRAQAQPTVELAGLVPTSGDYPEALLDGSSQTGWSPVGNPAFEGVLLRFSRPTKADHVRLKACPGSASFRVTPFVNSRRGRQATRRGDTHVAQLSRRKGSAVSVKSLFLRIDRPQGKVCLAEVTLELGGKPVLLRPPRRLKAQVATSSTLAPKEAYHGAYLFDNRLDFGWVEGASGPGVGQSVTFTFDSPKTMRAVKLWNGYQRSRDHFKKNARAKKISIRLDQRTSVMRELPSTMDPQTVPLPKVAFRKLTLTILSAYPGARFQDLVLSEIQFLDAQGPLAIVTDDLKTMRRRLQSKLAKTKLGGLLDRVWVSSCQDPGTGEAGDLYLDQGVGWGRLKLRSNHTFVYYQEYLAAETVEASGKVFFEVVDGTWVPTTLAQPWSQLRVFGRRNTVEKDVDETTYALKRSSSSTKIAGGTVQIAPVESLTSEQLRQEIVTWLLSAPGYKVSCLHAALQDHYVDGKQTGTKAGRAQVAAILSPKVVSALRKKLIKRRAFFIKGRAITDLMWQQKR